VQWKYIYNGREGFFTYNSLGCIHPTNPLREFCIRIYMTPSFDNAILALIALNSVSPDSCYLDSSYLEYYFQSLQSRVRSEE